MNFLLQLFVCFGIPLFGLFFYFKLFGKIQDAAVFKIGLITTINYLLWFTNVSTIYYGGVSGLNTLALLYLVFGAPLFSVGFIYYILRNRRILTKYHYALYSSFLYLAIIFISLVGTIFNHNNKSF